MVDIILFGFGNAGITFLHNIGEKNINYICDNNVDLWGKIYKDTEIISPQKLHCLKQKFVVIVCIGGQKQDVVMEQLEGMGIYDYVSLDEINKFTQEELLNVLNSPVQREKMRQNYLKNKIDRLNTQVNYFKRHVDIKNVKPAKGLLRKRQLDNVELAKSFMNSIEKLDVHFIIYDGSLLGYLRHNGYIPWDDDMDLLLLREEYEKIRKYFIERGNGDGRKWNSGDWILFDLDDRMSVACPKYFPSCAIDIFSMDYYEDGYSFDQFKSECEQLKREKIQLQTVCERREFIREKIDQNNHIVKKSHSLYWGLDNMDVYNKWNYKQWIPENVVFPLKKIVFEGLELYGVNDMKEFVKYMYQDCWDYPDDVGILPHCYWIKDY